MKTEEIIEGLKYTVDMCEYDPLTGDIIERCFMNEMTRTTYDACKAAIEFIEKHQYVHDKCKKCIEFSEFKQQSCEDCISRESVNQLIDELARAISDERSFISRGRSTSTIMEDILHLPSVKPQPEFYPPCQDCNTKMDEVRKAYDKYKWIPVSERLPEKQDCYLVTTKWKGSYSGDVYIETNMAVYRGKPKEWDCKNVIAWMPLPQQYKVESEDKE